VGSAATVSHERRQRMYVSHVLIEYLDSNELSINKRVRKEDEHLQALKISHVRLASDHDPEFAFRSLIERE